jgi:putative PIN family toxin of toxin-antitoxin system
VKVFLDTNVLREVFASHQLFISDQLLIELRRVLQLKLGVSQELIDEFIELLKRDSILAQPGERPPIELRDGDDLAILGAAISAGADVLITGDQELLELNQVSNLKVVSPRQFWERLKAQQQHGDGRKQPRRSR